MNAEPSIKRLFIISPIGEPASEDRVRSDQLREYIVEEIAHKMGYEVQRSDGISEPGTITNQIIERLIDDDLVVADLTNQNPNVFYELAVRHASDKPVILMGLRGQKIPFDISAQRVIFYDHKNLDSVKEAKIELEKQIKAVEEKTFFVDSPLSGFLQLELPEDDDDIDDPFQEIIAILRTQSNRIQNIEEILRTSAQIQSRVLERQDISRARERADIEVRLEQLRIDVLKELEGLENKKLNRGE